MLRGIDVSYHQGTIDWKKVKKAGVDFAFIRVAGRYAKSGDLFEDTKAVENMQGAQDVGIPYGVYIYSQAISQKEAKEEAAYILECIQGFDVTLPVVLDFEYYNPGLTIKEGGGRLWNAHLSKTEATNVCLAFCRYVENAGYTPMVYANKTMLTDDLNADLISQDYPIRLAHYTSSTNYIGDYTFWQYSSSAKIKGITGNVDVNVWYQPNMNAVQNVELTVQSDQLTLNWEPFSDAIGYEVWKRKDLDEYSLLQTIEGGTVTTFSDTDVIGDSVYVYKVRAVLSATQYGDYSTPAAGSIGITEPPVVQKKNGVFDSVTFSWAGVNAAQWYSIEIYNKEKAAFEEIKMAETCEFTDSGLSVSTTYKYRVRACRRVGSVVVYGPYSSTISVKTQSAAKGKVTSDILNVRAKPATTGKVLKTIKKNTVLTLKGSTGNWYCITVKVKGKKRTAYVSKDYVKVIRVKTPTISGKGKRFDRVKVTWTEVAKADGYELQRYNKKEQKYVTLKKTTQSSYTDRELKAGTFYQYRVRAYRIVSGTTVYSSYSSAISVATKEAINGKIKTNKVSLRKGAGTKYKAIGTAKKGKKVTVTGSKGNWYRVTVKIKGKKKTAYVHKKYVKL